MVWDILIAVGIGLSQLAITWYGIQISVKERRIRNAIIIGIIGGLGIVLTVFATVRNGRTQKALEVHLDRIEKNTENPPTINVNVPKPESPKKHGRVDFKQILLVSPPNARELFIADRAVQTNVYFENSGDGPIRDSLIGGEVIYSSKEDMEKHKTFERYGSSVKPTAAGGVLNPGLGNDVTAYQYHTFDGPKLTADQAKNLDVGQAALCTVAKMLWSDDTGKYETDFCRCFIRVADGSVQIFVQPEDNRESLLN